MAGEGSGGNGEGLCGLLCKKQQKDVKHWENVYHITNKLNHICDADSELIIQFIAFVEIWQWKI